jgi:hypothetical protein
MRTSYSYLEIFENCPKRYEFQVIEKISVPKSKEQLFGSLLHKCLKYLYRKAPIFPYLDELIDYYSVLWKEVEKKIKWRDEKEKEIYFNEGKRI